MPIKLNSPGWRVSRAEATRGGPRDGAGDLPGLPPEFLTADSRVDEEVVLEPAATTRGLAAGSPGLDLSYDVEPGSAAILAIRHQSGALTFHPPIQSTSRGLRGPTQVRFQVDIRQQPTRGIVSTAIKAILVKVGKVAVDKIVSFVLPKLAETLERGLWKKRGLTEGWLRVSKETLAAGRLAAGKPVSPSRSLLFIHGTFSNTVSAYRDLAKSAFFERIEDTYGDRIFGFDHFTLSRTPEENARMLLQALPEQTTTFDVVTHSRGGLVLRNLVERASQFDGLARRFRVGRAVLVASPNDGTPLATPKRWDDTIGWIANLLEMFPDNPFTTGPEFVANGLVWLANHASGALPGLHSMDADGEMITAIQTPPGPPVDAYSALVANYQPSDTVLQRLLDVGIDQFFGSANDLVVPSEGGWRIDRSGKNFIPAGRIGCFGPGGNLPSDSVTHVSFFSHGETVDFLVRALSGEQQPLKGVDPRKDLPDRKLSRGRPAPALAVRGGSAVDAAAVADRAQPRKAALHITVVNGDLTFESEALLLGHYRATQLTGTERVMDELIGGTMRRSLGAGLYPLSPGSHQIFINTRPSLERGSVLPRPKAVIVVGLGEEGNLGATQLVQTVRQAVIAWAQRLADTHYRDGTFELASTLIGSGGTGVSAGDAALLIARGVREANELLADGRDDQRRWPRVGHLRLIELYLDRATEAWRALRLQGIATSGRYDVDEAVARGKGGLLRPLDSGYRGANYDFINITTTKEGGTPQISYTLDTKRARSEVRGQRAQSLLLDDLIASASNDQNQDRQIGDTLFKLLIPVELEAYLAASGEIQLGLDERTARIPWELLDARTDGTDDRPWAIRARLLRKLRLGRFREQVVDADAEASALVIGEPKCPEEYPRLEGARREAAAVDACLRGPDGLGEKMVTALFSTDPSKAGPDARTVINALFEQPWRIIHIAGHGNPPAGASPGGVVLSNGTYLGPAEIFALRPVPELVFVNCCFLATSDVDKPPRIFDRATFAASVAGALIDIGVHCVIAAGWAVDDDVATVFAEEFYASLLRGSRFIDAVGEAREAAYDRNPDTNTWAAYQCYGDPNWRLRRKAADPNRAAGREEDSSDVASATALILRLQTIIVEAKFQGGVPAVLRGRLQKLEERFGETWGKSGSVAEVFGEAFAEVGSLESGVRWYKKAVSALDGTASMRAAEQLANIQGRLAWEQVDEAERYRNAIVGRGKGDSATQKARVASRRAFTDADRKLRASIRKGERLVRDSLVLLNKLRAVEKTMERESLVGSAHKRRALIDTVGGTPRRVEQDLKGMRAAYEEAAKVGRAAGETDLFYPESNCLVADVALNAGRRHLDRKLFASVQESLAEKSRKDADFWSIVGTIELRQYDALTRKRLASEYVRLERAYQDLHKRVTGTRMWLSVYDTACLVLRTYAGRVSEREKRAASALLELLRKFAHPHDAA